MSSMEHDQENVIMLCLMVNVMTSNELSSNMEEILDNSTSKFKP